MEVQLYTEADTTVLKQEQITELYQELNADIHQLPLAQVLGKNRDTVAAVCKTKGRVIGLALMASYKVISGHKGMIEDVVVASEHRGKGIGKKMMTRLLIEAQNRKMDQVLLFSGHHRKVAINMYKGLGFTLKDSGLYVKNLLG